MAIQDADDLIYETNEKGEQVLVRSIPTNVRTYLRFTNTTNSEVDLYWRDFRGNRIKYTTIAEGKHYDINTYLTHPWEFRDAGTDELYYINNKPFFRSPENTGGMNYRTNWNIHIGMRTLRHTVLLKLASLVKDPENVSQLDLPRALENELKERLVALKRRALERVNAY